ncbi:hypothetical protein JTB14_017963 [Gonioctena quinquepunctata]|nr:hypothetical protein JTB14_017963 [Gonioctena quinquepunctata]
MIRIYRRLPRLCFAARNQNFENRGTPAWQPGFKSGRRGDTQRSSRLMKEEDDEHCKAVLFQIFENEFEMGPNLEDEDYLEIVATPELDEKYLYTGRISSQQ